VPKLPGIPGIDSFAGHAFHTSRWDYAYTGGDPSCALMDKLADKRVALIGTGATAVQCVPHLGEGAKELFVFQRTPSSVDVRADRPTDPDWAKSLQPGWQRERMHNFTTVISGGRFEVDLVNDGWTDLINNIALAAHRHAQAGGEVADPEALVQRADDLKMQKVRARVDAVVQDPATADALKPWYNQFCKRPCFHDEYLQAYNEPGVHLVDTDGQGVRRVGFSTACPSHTRQRLRPDTCSTSTSCVSAAPPPPSPTFSSAAQCTATSVLVLLPQWSLGRC
jgi:cyclohexanone monooxygenase